MTDDDKLREIIAGVSAEPFTSEYEEMYDVGYDAMKWKGKQTIDKACEWLEENLIKYWGQINANNTEEFIKDFKKAMEEK